MWFFTTEFWEDTEFVGVFLFSSPDAFLTGGGSLHPLDAGFFTTEFWEDTEFIGVSPMPASIQNQYSMHPEKKTPATPKTPITLCQKKNRERSEQKATHEPLVQK
jgi:hypothetical protein